MACICLRFLTAALANDLLNARPYVPACLRELRSVSQVSPPCLVTVPLIVSARSAAVAPLLVDLTPESHRISSLPGVFLFRSTLPRSLALVLVFCRASVVAFFGLFLALPEFPGLLFCFLQWYVFLCIPS